MTVPDHAPLIRAPSSSAGSVNRSLALAAQFGDAESPTVVWIDTGSKLSAAPDFPNRLLQQVRFTRPATQV